MLKVLRKKREMTMAQILSQERYCRTKARTASLEALQARLELAKRYRQDFQDIELNIFMRKSDEQSQMDEFEEVFCYVVGELTSCINFRTAECDTQTLSVPIEDFPRFNGRYDMWKEFEFIYTIVIHNNKTLTNKTKFQLLIDLLANEPRSVIDDISFSDANYNEAWLQIKSHYNSPKFIVNTVVRNLLSRPIVKSGDAGQLKELLEVTEGAITYLGTLGNGAQARDPWLIGILLQKLDGFTQKMWISELKYLDFPTFSDFIKFLNVRMQMLMGYRYVCQAKQLCSADASTSSVRSPRSRDNRRRYIASISLAKVLQESCSKCPGTESDCKSHRRVTFRSPIEEQGPSSSLTQSSQIEEQEPTAIGTNTDTEARPSEDSCQLNGKETTESHEFESPSTVVVTSTGTASGAVKKLFVRAIAMDENSDSSEVFI